MQFPIEKGIATPPEDFPTANLLKIDGNAGQIPPQFQFALIKRETSTRTVEVVTGKDPETQEDITKEEEVIDSNDTVLRAGLVTMTDQQWTAWKNQPDAGYILQCAADALGVTLV